MLLRDHPQLRDKLHLIYWPSLRLMGALVGGYGLADAALQRWVPTFEPPDELRGLVLPWGLAALAAALLLWPRLRLLAGSGQRADPRLLLLALGTATMACGASCLHYYLQARQGALARYESPAAGPDRPGAFYYQFGQARPALRYSGRQVEFTVTDRPRQLVLSLYVAVPLLASPADTLRPARAWRGVAFYDHTDLQASDDDKQAAYEAFLQRSEQALQAEQFALPFGYYERLPRSKERAQYVRAARRSRLCPPDTTQPLLVLQPAAEAYAARGSEWGCWLLRWLGGGPVLYFLLLLFPALPPAEAQAYRAGQRPRLGWLRELRPSRRFWLTPALLALNTGLFLLMSVCTLSATFQPGVLLAWGACYGPAVAQGQWWRLLSSQFVHSSFPHLASNLAALWLLGPVLEPAVGPARYALLYLGAGLAGALASVAWHPAAIGAGASGALFGLLGAGLVLAALRVLPEPGRRSVLLLAATLGGFGLLTGWLIPGIDNAAHLGGLVGGGALALLVLPGLRRPPQATKRRRAAAAPRRRSGPRGPRHVGPQQ